jgi:hypothetical protein
MSRRLRLGAVLLLAAAAPAWAARTDLPDGNEASVVLPSGELPAEAAAIRKTLEIYARAVMAKDIELFKSVKPTLSGEEERRARAAFKSVASQTVRINVVSLDVKDGDHATVKVTRRDTLNGSIVSSFPQTFSMSKGASGWIIQDIGR